MNCTAHLPGVGDGGRGLVAVRIVRGERRPEPAVAVLPCR